MQLTNTIKTSLLALLLISALNYAQAAEANAANATVDEPKRLDEVEVIEDRSSALTQAITDSKLLVFQPQSILGNSYINNNTVPTADYSTIINIAPSVVNISANGPGLTESKASLRGFADGQYNVTMDGIPFSDYNSFTHHTTSYFPAKLIGQVVVDRGPGSADAFGNATFGGTIGMFSKDPSANFNIIPTASFGSWNTQLFHLEADSGHVSQLHDSMMIGSYQHMSTDGARSNEYLRRDTYYYKDITKLSPSTTLTLMGTYNVIHYNTVPVVTLANILAYGRDFGLFDTSSAYYLNTSSRAYNFLDKRADFSYIGIESNLGSKWSLENKTYTHSYNNLEHQTPKLNTSSQMTGLAKLNEYRTVGDTFKLSHDDNFGTLKFGAWFDYTTNHRSGYVVNYFTTGPGNPTLVPTDLSFSGTPNPAGPVLGQAGTATVAPIDANPNTFIGGSAYGYNYKLVDYCKAFQPFIEYMWNVSSTFTIDAGVKYMTFSRNMHAAINQTKAREALNATRHDQMPTPSINFNYRFSPAWSGYAQIAQGFQAPSEGNSFYVSNASYRSGNVHTKPETTLNYQLGTVYKQDRLNADVDFYYINFSYIPFNIADPLNPSGDPLSYSTSRGAYYSGVETEATYYLAGGLSIYANGAINKATYKGSEMQVGSTPNGTAVAGFVYDRKGIFASLTDKYAGRMVVYDKNFANPDNPGGLATPTSVAPVAIYSGGYALVDATLGYSTKIQHSFIKSFKIRLTVSNIFNKDARVLSAVGATRLADSFNVLPLRGYFVTTSLDF